MRAPSFLVATALAALVCSSAPVDAQIRVARPRSVIGVRPAIVVRRPATVFVGGYYYPRLYRASLFYGGYGYGYGDPWYYGGYRAYYQWPVFGGGRYDLSGSIRLQVAPREAEVFVDGYFAGRVDEYDGVFQRLHIEPGEHEIHVYLPGHRTFQQRVYLQPGKTFTIRHTMEPLGPGESTPARPDAGALPPPRPRYDDEGGRGTPPEARGPNPGPRGQGAGRGRQGGPVESFGSLSLRVQPADAEVLIDGEPWKGSLDSDRLVVQLGAGMHHIEIRKDGYRSYLTDISIGGGQVRTLNVALTRQ